MNTNKSGTTKYRREIDGLRAFAVIPVILFHAGFQSFSGGFVGVDVFFVISGYLITTIILAQKDAGTFSLLEFYERRARRILPALFFVMAVSIPFAWLWLLPQYMKEFSESLVAVSTFASNVLFWKKGNYFDTAVELKPLIHTWSLAVEEQYYLLFPIFIIITWRYGKRLIVGLLVLIAVLSLGAADWGAYNHPISTFFLLPTRGWEIAVGALVAIYYAGRLKSNTSLYVRQSASILGFALIAFSIFAFDKNTPFPSLYALAPTAGAALVIVFATPQTYVGRALGTKFAVGIGLISYSAYLWHQPIFAFARHRSLVEPSQFFLGGLAGAAIVFAYLSWRFVEMPFRNKDRFSRSKVFGLAAIFSTAFVGVGLIGYYTAGTFGRENSKDLAELEYRERVNHGLGETCEGSFTLSAECRTSDSPEILVWGDSFAMHLIQGLVESRPGIKVIQNTVSSCGPILDIAQKDAKLGKKWAEDCIHENDEVYASLKSSKTIKYVLLSSPFSQYLGDDATIYFRDGSFLRINADQAYHYMISTLDRIKAIGIEPVVFSPTPMNGKDIGLCVIKAKKFALSSDQCDFELSEAISHQPRVFSLLKRVSESYKVVWLADGICRDGLCKATVGNKLIYRDGGHLSYEGSTFIGGEMGFYHLLTGN